MSAGRVSARFAGKNVSSPSYGRGFQPDAQVTPGQYVKMLEDIVVCFAGHEAEAAYRGRQNWRGSAHDRAIAIDLAAYLSGDAESFVGPAEVASGDRSPPCGDSLDSDWNGGGGSLGTNHAQRRRRA